MEIIINTSKNDEIVDVTDKLNDFLGKKNEAYGILNIFVKHTTCALTTSDLDPGTDLDFLNFLRKISPDIKYHHPHDPSHTPDHLLSSVIGASLSVPFENKNLILGAWQRVVLIELNGPRERTIKLSIIKSLE